MSAEPVWGPNGERWLRKGRHLISDLYGDEAPEPWALSAAEIAALEPRELQWEPPSLNVVPIRPRVVIPPKERLHVRSAGDLVEARPVEWLVQDLFPRANVALLAGAEFSGKTFLMQELMIAAALGQAWHGRTVERVRSYATFGEDHDERVLIPRRNSILERYGNADCRDLDEWVYWTAASEERPDFDPALYRCARFKAAGAPTPLWRESLEYCADMKIGLWIIDNASAVLEGSDGDHVKSFCRLLIATAMRTGMAIVLLHHPNKARDAIYSGSANWARALRHILVLGRPKGADPDNDDGKRVFRVYDSNCTGERPRLYMRREKGGVLVADEAPIEVNRTWPLSPSEKRELQYRVLVAMRTVVDRGGRVVADSAHALSMSGRTRSWSGWHFSREQIDDAVAELVKGGQAVREGKEVRPS